MLAEMKQTNYAIYDVWFGRRPPFVLDDPRFVPPAKKAGAAGP